MVGGGISVSVNCICLSNVGTSTLVEHKFGFPALIKLRETVGVSSENKYFEIEKQELYLLVKSITCSSNSKPYLAYKTAPISINELLLIDRVATDGNL